MSHTEVTTAESIPALPEVDSNMTAWRKEALLKAVACVHMPEVTKDWVCSHYSISLEEFEQWKRDYDEFGILGLKITRRNTVQRLRELQRQ